MKPAKIKETEVYQLIMPRVIYHDSHINATEKLILTEIFNLFKAGNKHCYASNGHFAEMFALEKSNVSKCIQKLQKRGWIISKSFKDCKQENCTLRETGWHRHIIAGDTLSNIFDRLSNIFETLSKKQGYPMEKPGIVSNNIENNIENKENHQKIDEIKRKIRKNLKRM